MYIEKILPNIVADKCELRGRLLAEAIAQGMTNDEAREIISMVPSILINAKAFLDELTNLWRYEFGIPYDVNETFIWGTHMWVPVKNLFSALTCAHSRLPHEKYVNYLNRLADPSKHQASLVEMIPGCKIDSTMDAKFEVSGHGVGNKQLDWLIQPQGDRNVLLDVKRRTFDFIKQTERLNGEPVAPEPDHDPELLFRSVESKLLPAGPQLNLQGVWVVTDIQQDEKLLSAAFSELDSDKVHFAILGDWNPDAYVLTKRAEDESYLRNLFHITNSSRFTFTNVKG